MAETIELESETFDILQENENDETEILSETEQINLPIINKPPPKPKVEPRTPDHFALIDKIFSYKKTFPKECEHIQTDKFDKASLAELEKEEPQGPEIVELQSEEELIEQGANEEAARHFAEAVSSPLPDADY